MRTRLLWTVFSACVVVVVVALAWVSMIAADLEDAKSDARQRADLEEDVRLALYRMSLALSPLIQQEISRPYFTYGAFYAPEQAYTKMFESVDATKVDVFVPSPLLTLDFAEISVHFQVDPDGTFTSPQVPTSNMRDMAESRGFTTRERIERADTQLQELESLVTRDGLMAALPVPPEPDTLAMVGSYEFPLNILPEPEHVASPSSYGRLDQRPARGNWTQQQMRNDVEVQARNRADEQQATCAVDVNGIINNVGNCGTVEPVPLVREGTMTAVWVESELVFARRVLVGPTEYVQGCRLNWPRIEESLLATSVDLLPDAKLMPVSRDGCVENDRLLSFLPVKLVPGVPAPVEPEESFSSLKLFLTVAWTCGLVAAAAIGALLFGAFSLSERRRRFVSAVTHELRTPLTTFRMYTEMLNEGMVQGEEKRREYIGKLNVEADRLGHLVENVLAFARLEESSKGKCMEKTSVGELLERVTARLAERVGQANLVLDVVEDEDSLRRRVCADVAAVERVLFNLVDNACKYGVPCDPPVIHIEVEKRGAVIGLVVRDHGPGVPVEKLQGLFQPFQKGDGETTSQSPGVGLGLALCRRLAQDMGGTLELDRDYGHGARFVLSLPTGD